jgi:hypothetical protein
MVFTSVLLMCDQDCELLDEEEELSGRGLLGLTAPLLSVTFLVSDVQVQFVQVPLKAKPAIVFPASRQLELQFVSVPPVLAKPAASPPGAADTEAVALLSYMLPELLRTNPTAASVPVTVIAYTLCVLLTRPSVIVPSFTATNPAACRPFTVESLT